MNKIKRLIPFLIIISPILIYHLIDIVVGEYQGYGPEKEAWELFLVLLVCNLYYIEFAIMSLIYAIKIAASVIKKSSYKWRNIIVTCKYLSITAASIELKQYIIEEALLKRTNESVLHRFTLILCVIEILFIVGNLLVRKIKDRMCK